MKQFFFVCLFSLAFAASPCAQTADTALTTKDSLQNNSLANAADTVVINALVKPVFKLKNKLLNISAKPVSLAVQLKKVKSRYIIIYTIIGLLLLVAFLKYFYSRYFTNLFRVFFNTSLRQSQLTDQLLQAKLPSLLFNLFFVFSAGIYVYTLLSFYQLINSKNRLAFMFSLIVLFGIVYFIKFCTLKFTGWLTGYKEVTNTYIFVIFLINKIIGIFLVPFIIILSFSDIAIVKIAALISLMTIGIFLLLRFFKSYGLLQNQLKINRVHFFLYVAGIEILPLMLIYKGLMIFLSKNL